MNGETKKWARQHHNLRLAILWSRNKKRRQQNYSNRFAYDPILHNSCLMDCTQERTASSMQEVKGCPVSAFTNRQFQWVFQRFLPQSGLCLILLIRTLPSKVSKGNETCIGSVWRHGRSFIMSYCRWYLQSNVKALNRDVSQWQSLPSVCVLPGSSTRQQLKQGNACWMAIITLFAASFA